MNRLCVPPPTRAAIIEGLVTGTLEIISSDHAPHCDYEKEVEFDYVSLLASSALKPNLALSLNAALPFPAAFSLLVDLIAKFTSPRPLAAPAPQRPFQPRRRLLLTVV